MNIYNTHDNLPLNKPLKLHMLTIIFRCIFEKYGKFYPQLYLDDCLYEAQMLEYDRTDISEEIDVNKTNASKECDILWVLMILFILNKVLTEFTFGIWAKMI